MKIVLIATQHKEQFLEFAGFFQENKIVVSYVKAGEEALSYISKEDVFLLVADEHLSDMPGLELIEKSLLNHPMISSAAVSSLSSEDYHEASEGYGILMQLPVQPGRDDAEKLYFHLENILSQL